MSKPLDARIASAMGQGARIATVLALIEEVDAAISETRAEHDRLDALSKSATAAEDEADAAADDAAKLARKIIRLGAKRAQLEARHTDLQNCERRGKAAAAHAEAKARRDELVADLRREWPELERRIVTFLARIKASEAECDAVNRDRSFNLEWLDGAEALARGCPGNFRRDVQGIARLVDIVLPAFDASGEIGNAWPRPVATFSAMQAEQERRRQEKLAKDAERATWKRYIVTPPDTERNGIDIPTVNGMVRLLRTGECMLAPAHVEQIRALGCKMEGAKEGWSFGRLSGLPSF